MPYADNDVYNIVLNSLNKASGTNADATYYYDWSVIPKGEYMMTLDYIGGANTFNSARFGIKCISTTNIIQSHHILTFWNYRPVIDRKSVV